jgi:hypothetical protein
VSEGRIAKPLAVFVLLVVGLLLVTAAAAFVVGEPPGSADGRAIQGQSPAQFQPGEVLVDTDPEEGGIAVERGEKRILIDTEHGNEFDRASLEPIAEALFTAGHDVTFSGEAGGTGVEYAESLGEYDALVIIQPTGGFDESERNAVKNFTDGGGRLLVLAEPTQSEAGGLFSAPSTVSFGAEALIAQYGLRVGADQLYNVNDSGNDNNFKSVYAVPSAESELTAGVERVTFDTGGYVVLIRETEAEVLLTAVEGTRTLQTRRAGEYPMAVRTGNVAFVADSSFIKGSEVYDADNEVLLGNLLAFLAGGEAPGPVGPDDSEGEGTETPTPPPEPTEAPTPPPEPTEAPTPTPEPTETPGL